MCGIAGFLADKPLNADFAKRLSRALLYYSESRGSQSGGVYLDGQLLKKAINPHEFIDLPEFDQLFATPCRNALLHTRQPTCGERTDIQAQPFAQNNTVSIHNGYYFDIAGIKKQWGLVKSSGVDSELVTDFIEAYGIAKLGDFLDSTDGPSSIAAIHKGKLYLARSGNPLAYAIVKYQENSIFVFASTKEILQKALSYCFLCNNFNIQSLPECEIFQVFPNKITSLHDFLGHSMNYNSWDYGAIYDKPKKKRSKDYYKLVDTYSQYDDNPPDCVEYMERFRHNVNKD